MPNITSGYARKSIGFDMDIKGLNETLKAAKLFPRRVFNKVMRRANNLAMTPVLKAARKGTNIFSKPPRGASTGAYKKALARKTKQYRPSWTTYTIVGARSDFVMGDNKPNKYAHLLELGHRIAPRRKGARLDRWRERRNGSRYFVKGNSQPLKTRVRPFPLIKNTYTQTGRGVRASWLTAFRAGCSKEASTLGLKWI